MHLFLFVQQVHQNHMIWMGGRRQSPYRHLSIMLFSIILAFLLLNFPNCIMFLLKYHYCQHELCKMGAPSWIKDAIIVANTLNITNSAINCVLYCCVGSKFCNEFKAKFSCCRCCKRKKSSKTSTGVINTFQITIDAT